MSDAVIAFGSVINHGSAAGVGGDPIEELQTIGGPSLSGDSIDVSSHESADGAGDMFREFLAGLKDAGEISLEGNWIPGATGQAALLADYLASTTDEYTIEWPTVAPVQTVYFDAFVTRFEITGPHDNKLGFSATLKITGAPTFS